ncbi:ABC transporter substrate-binding protein [Halodesulfurarchaeum sp. HSR-GB]|uniref:ABC transporter substrate-binding protein n=1 Tax=Halodesulfurarchaeum sp. HSR-GB TaxID=3074077 RepID=UPI00285A9166|nr:ABC transporter substrate-binding protein [Halodesulfurarchaeum sp. HSR-GB]MDR5656364.1 ABC transporter substrate-binding protein [Halodesulfurarchaeum sp. HSR-GB]
MEPADRKGGAGGRAEAVEGREPTRLDRRTFLRTAGTALVTSSLAGLAGCSGGRETQPTLSIGYKPKFAALQYLVMSETGTLSELDAAVEPTNFAGTDASIVSAFADGDLDVGFFGVTQTLKMIEKGVPATGVAANHKNGFVLVGEPTFADQFESEGADAFRQRSEERGEPVQFTTGPAGGMGNLVTTYWLFEELGLSRDVIDIQTMAGIKAIRRSLLSGNAAGTALDEPTLTRLATEDAAVEYLAEPESFLPELPGGIMVVRDELLAERPALARDVTRAHVQATELINDQPAEAAAAASAAIGDSLSTATARQAIDSAASTYVSDPREIEAGTGVFADYMRSEGLLDSDVGFATAFDLEVYDAVSN